MQLTVLSSFDMLRMSGKAPYKAMICETSPSYIRDYRLMEQRMSKTVVCLRVR